MKFKFSKLAMFIEWFSCLCFGAFLVLIVYIFIRPPISDIYELSGIIIVIVLGCVFTYIGEYTHRFVEFTDELIRFNSFRFRMKRKTMSVSVRYEDIYCITVKKAPLIGLWAVRVHAGNAPHEISLNICFKNHNALYKELCARAKQHKPDIYIDPYIYEHLEKKKGKT